uniref:Uncharacterized protein n=1 Tax=Leersia perrieri TaxID=77586 RepID=A0A0D9XJ52_9ORYZ
MSSIVRSLASVYCQGLRRTVRLGDPAAAAAVTAERAPAIHRPRSFLSKVDRVHVVSGGSSGQGQQGSTPLFTWARLAVGSVFAVVAPFLHSKWATLLRIQSEVEMVKEAAETAAEVVEEVAAAAAAEKVSAEVAEQLPENGRLRRAAVMVEHASKEVAEEAHLAHDIIHKAQ